MGAAVTAYATFSLPTQTVTDCSSSIVEISTTDADSTLGFDIDVGFESAVVAVQSVSIAGTLTAGCEFAYNDTDPDRVNISIACTTPVNGSGAIARITFEPVSEASTPLTFEECFLDEDDCLPISADGNLTISGCPSIDLSSNGNGSYGLSPGTVCLAATINPDASSVASTSTEITFDSTKFSLNLSTGCSVNPTLNPNQMMPKKILSQTDLGPGHRLISVTGDTSAIPNGPLFICNLTVVTGVANGSYPVTNVSSSAGPSSNTLPTSGIAGIVRVTNCAADCNGSGSVKINEVSRTSGMFLGDPLCNAADPSKSCPNADMIQVDGQIKINEVSRASCLYLNGTCSKTCP